MLKGSLLKTYILHVQKWMSGQICKRFDHFQPIYALCNVSISIFSLSVSTNSTNNFGKRNIYINSTVKRFGYNLIIRSKSLSSEHSLEIREQLKEGAKSGE